MNITPNHLKESVKKCIREGKYFLDPDIAFSIIKDYGITIPRYAIAHNKKEALKYYQLLGPSVAMKILSPDILHKTDAGGVLVNLNNTGAVKDGYDHILANSLKYKSDANIEGVFMQEMVKKGEEVILGIIKDKVFGWAVMFGAGGTLVELYQDVSHRLIPLNEREALEMLHETKIYRLMSGWRGMPPLDYNSIVQALQGFSRLADTYGHLINEAEINPLVVHAEGCVAVDVRIILNHHKREDV